MNVSKIEENLQALVANLDEATFIYELLLAYGKPKSSITRLKSGTYNLSKQEGEVLWKKQVFFKQLVEKDLHAAIDGYRRDQAVLKHTPRFIIVTDYTTLLAVDTKTNDTLDIAIQELNRHYDFFLPWAGREKAQVQIENPADVKAAGKLALLYDEIFKDNPFNPEKEPEKAHALNVFLCRLLFCFFAEDTEIFKEQSCFTHSIKNQTQEDGSDVSRHLERLFEVLSLPENDPKRKKHPVFLQAFPYVNGGLFKDEFKAPRFSQKSRKLLLESGGLDWSAINPDIFGSMMQAVVHTGQRASLGMHYTSVPNIMKVIEPLFLNELREELEKAEEDIKKLEKLHKRVQNIKIFDPACGSGNFLIIAYKELRRLEMELFQAMQEAQPQLSISLTKIALTQFYGIEIDDFAHEVAILSLWLAEHQMNVEFKDLFGVVNPMLPLKPGGNVVCGNATRMDWETVCPKSNKSEIFILGNPPYLGQRNQKNIHIEDLNYVFYGNDNYRNLDYICCWFLKAAQFIDLDSKAAFVTTNSICQGSHLSMLWPKIHAHGIEIFFAYKSFKWSNNAKNKAGVTCSIIGLSKINSLPKYLFHNETKEIVKKINPYLEKDKRVIITSHNKQISGMAPMLGGNQPREGGYLTLSDSEKIKLVEDYPVAIKFIKRFIGTTELLHNILRWCIWIEDNKINEALEISAIAEKVNQVKLKRENGNTVEKSFSHLPHRFVQIHRAKNAQIVIPNVSSERRTYIPIGYLDSEFIIANSANVIYDPEPYMFGIITSYIHMQWVKAVSGKLENRIRYSPGLSYNSFPVPKLSFKQIEVITTHVFNIFSEREKHPEKTLAELYDPDEMPAGLRQAHQHLDEAVERCYGKTFHSDEARLEHLFKLYEEMTQSPQLELQHA